MSNREEIEKKNQESKDLTAASFIEVGYCIIFISFFTILIAVLAVFQCRSH
jgi:hypothetical protein